jgi:DNA primase
VQNPGLAELVGELSDLADTDIPGLDLLLELVDFCRQRPNMTTAQVLESLRGHDAHSHLVKLAVWPLPGDPEVLTLEFQDAVTGLRLQQLEQRLSQLPRIVEQDAAQKQEYRDLQRRKTELKDSLQGRLS